MQISAAEMYSECSVDKYDIFIMLKSNTNKDDIDSKKQKYCVYHSHVLHNIFCMKPIMMSW